MSDKAYRQAMAALREYLAPVEVAMSRGDFESINYSGVTSRAMTRYRKAFGLDTRGFKYLDSLVKGESKVNASTLFPYDIMEGLWVR